MLEHKCHLWTFRQTKISQKFTEDVFDQDAFGYLCNKKIAKKICFSCLNVYISLFFYIFGKNKTMLIDTSNMSINTRRKC